MAFGNVFILSLLLVVSWTYVDARSLPTYDIMVMQVSYEIPNSENKFPEALERNEQLCTLCEEYTALATNYLNANKTETEIMDTLHQACSQLRSFEAQCDILTNYYATLFFQAIGEIRPEDFCTKVNLCEKMTLVIPKKEDTCTLCHRVVDDILVKLKDPESQLEIIQILLKECNKIEHYVQECKRMVFRYGPLILVNGEKFLESTDICSSIHACSAKREEVGPEMSALTLVLDA